jgi:hypothetical protein
VHLVLQPQARSTPDLWLAMVLLLSCQFLSTPHPNGRITRFGARR